MQSAREVQLEAEASLPPRPGGVLKFQVPSELEASVPPEARGLARDEVRLMVSYRTENTVVHSRFRDLGTFLDAGDLLVINTSGTLNAALPATRADGTSFELHVSTHLPADLYVVEVRRPNGLTTVPFYDVHAGETLTLPAGAAATLHVQYARDRNRAPSGRTRLWIATLQVPTSLETYLAQHGFPIRYGYVKQSWPSTYYQTVYATELGSAEMPSAGRAFTRELIACLANLGIDTAPLILHIGVASLENDEPLYEEFYRVPSGTARAVNKTRTSHGRVVAVGTSVVRTLETVTGSDGITHPGEGWTSLCVGQDRSVRAVDALLTGFHEPCATHLAMLEALAGREHLEIAYAEALRNRYLWHEFGDLHLLLP